MSHRTFKVSIIIDETVENFYIKHYVDDYQPIFHKFKTMVFQRNPSVNHPNLKVYWIDAENDKILISCEEDFRLYIEEGHGTKLFFSVLSSQSQQPAREDEDEAMDAEDEKKCDRRSRKSTREEEKQRRATKRLTEKMRHAEEKLRAEEERRAKHPEKYERKNAERLERAKKRCDQIRQIIGASIGAFDPANLNSNSPCNAEAQATASSAPQSESMSTEQAMDVLNPSAETIRLLSTAIAGCLQPCNLINKILNEIIAFVPQPTSEVAAGAPAEKASADQQQQTPEVQRQNSATNTSDVNTPVVTGHPSSAEIEALFKEAAKELEKMNEIVANSNKNSMQTSASSLFSNLERSQSSSTTAITQIEKNVMAESTVSNATLMNDAAGTSDEIDARDQSPENDFKIVTPPKSMRSRESSIEVHDVNSMMSDDSRDWTMVDAAGNDQDDSLDGSVPPANSEKSPEYLALINSFTAETQTLASLINKPGPSSAMTQEEVQSSIQKSIKSVGEMNEMVKNSVASAQQSLQNIEKPVEILQPVVVTPPTPPVLVLRPNDDPKPSATRKIEIQVEPAKTISPAQEALLAFLKSQKQSSAPAPAAVQKPAVSAETRAVPVAAPTPTPSAPPTGAVPKQTAIFQGGHLIHQLSATTQANLAASRAASAPKAQKPVVVYDPNPKINAAVHTMLAMGFTNEGGWLTQLLLNVDGDVPAAINFLTPQPKK